MLGCPIGFIEVVTPGTFAPDFKTKYDLYAKNGVGEYWVVLPGEQNVSVFVMQNGKYQIVGDFYEPGLIPCHTLPELHLEGADVFEGVE